MEKRLVLFLVLTFAMLIVWQMVMVKPRPKKPADQDSAQGTGAAPGGAPETPKVGQPTETPKGPAPTKAPSAETVTLPRQVAAGAVAVAESEPVDTPTSRWVFDSFGGSVREVRLKKYTKSAGDDLSEPGNWYGAIVPWMSDKGRKPKDERALTFDVVSASGKTLIDLTRVDWGPPQIADNRVAYRLEVPAAGVVFEKEFLLAQEVDGVEAGPYHADFTLALTVTDPALAAGYGADEWRIRLRAAGGVPVDQFASGTLVTAAVMTRMETSVEEFTPSGNPEDEPEVYPDPEDQGEERLVRWVGIHGRFFGAILAPYDEEELGSVQAVIQPIAERQYNGKKSVSLAPAIDFVLPLPGHGETVSRSFLYYVGPMDPDVLSEGIYEPFEPIIDLGMFEIIAKPLMALLGLIRSVVGNWGVAIIILTLIVRMSMFPISRRSQLSMQKYQRQMGRLKPKMDALKAKYQDKNKKKMNEELMKLYRDEGVSMVPKGCLVMFLQLPVFIGLFQGLRYTIGLRHSGFLWAKDLTAPDQLFGLAFSTKGIPLVPDPLYLNILPILMGITWYLSSAMAPKPADPQQAQQMKMMKWMPVLFSIFLYNYPAGLALYMVTSSTWSIFEMKVVRKLLDKGEAAPTDEVKGFRKGR